MKIRDNIIVIEVFILNNLPGKISNEEILKKSSSRAGFLRKALKSVWDEEEDGVNLDFLDPDMIRTEIKGRESRNWECKIEIGTKLPRNGRKREWVLKCCAEGCSRLPCGWREEPGVKQGFLWGERVENRSK